MRALTLQVAALWVTVIFGLSCATAHDHWSDEDDTASPPKASSTASSATPPPESFVVPPSDDDTEVDDNAPPPATPGAVAVPSSPVASDATPAPAPDSEAPMHEIPVIVEKGPPPSGSQPEAGAATSSDSAFINVPAAKPHRRKSKKHHKKKKHETEESTGVPIVIEEAPLPGTPEPAPQPREAVKSDDSDLFASDSSSQHVDAHDHAVGLTPATTGESSIPEAPMPPPPPDLTLHRDKLWKGISITAGGGVFLSKGTRTGYEPQLAYGGQITIDPRFIGSFALDLGFWRTGQTTGTSFDSVVGSTNEISARALYLPRIGRGVFIGGGLGFDMTWTTADYLLDGTSTSASQFQPGGEAAFVLGWRSFLTSRANIEVRLDVRAILSGGLRMDYLPTLSVGVTF